MKRTRTLFWTLVSMFFWTGSALAAGDSGPGAMGDGGMMSDGGMMQCDGMMGMMMGGFMIVPMLAALLLLVTLILAILALIKYLRRG